MEKNFFNKVRILDGGMGQELLRRGLKPRGTLWSAEALIKENYHSLIVDTPAASISAFDGQRFIAETRASPSRKSTNLDRNRINRATHQIDDAPHCVDFLLILELI